MPNSQLDALIAAYENLVEAIDAIATAPDAEPEALEKLAALTDAQIETSVSLNPNTPPRILERMLKRYCGNGGDDPERRIHIVNNRALPVHVLKRVARTDQSTDVRASAAVVLAQRLAVSARATPDALWGSYMLLQTNLVASRAKRRRGLEKALTRHPNFRRRRLR